MSKPLKLWQALAASGVLAFAAGSASALPETYGNIVAPGVYFGTLNSNGDFTINTSGNIEAALRVKDRSTLATVDGSSGIYHVAAGLCSGGFCNTPDATPKATWNVEFSVNSQAGGSGFDLTNYLIKLSFDIDPSGGVSFLPGFDVTALPDNAYWNGAKREANPNVPLGPVAGEFGVQNSENPVLIPFPLFDPFATGLYDIRLDVFTRDGLTLLASTDIQVQVPEPASLALLGLGLAGLGFSRRKKQA